MRNSAGAAQAPAVADDKPVDSFTRGSRLTLQKPVPHLCCVPQWSAEQIRHSGRQNSLAG
jgi:hypothetical protein